MTTDLGGADPDDEQSMVHLLVGANEFEIEGLVCGLAWVNRGIGIDLLNAIVDDYGKVLPNLRRHAEGYPSYEYLKAITTVGQSRPLLAGVGDGKDSPGSELIIAAVDKDDPRPVWINAWGGTNTLAQALWKVRSTRSAEALDKFVRKIRVYDILGQDDAGAWMAKTFPQLFYIRNRAVYGWAPSDEWVKTNVQRQGPLGARYRSRVWAIEGDSPAFMHVYANGLNDPEAIEQGGWGGRFSWAKQTGIRIMDITRKSGVDETVFDPYEMYGATPEGVAAISRWKEAIYNDLAARMQWSVTGTFADANHHPLAVVNGDASKRILKIAAAPGALVTLDASGSSDPDHDPLSFAWMLYPEAGTYQGAVTIQSGTSPLARIAIPANAAGKTIHIILELSDAGTPKLSAYRRAIIEVQ